MKPILVTIVRDPEGKLLEALENTNFGDFYSKVFVNATIDTDKRVLDVLGKQAHVITTQRTSLSNARRLVLGQALNITKKDTGVWGNYYHYCDLDRLLFWINHYPDELKQVLKLEKPFVIFGRTPTAFNSHPFFQKTTEKSINFIYRIFTFKNQDLLAASRLIRYQIADIVLYSSKARGVGVDIEWPFLTRKYNHYVEVEGLAYESDYFNTTRNNKDEIKLRLRNVFEFLQTFWNL